MDFPLLIFTDLDGTLLDHHSYSFQGAAKAMKRLRQHAVPLVFASSKTRAELQELQNRLALHQPFIAENGGGLFIPADYAMIDVHGLEQLNGYYVKRFGRPYQEIRKTFATLKSKYPITGFGDMSVAAIISTTGLARKDAVLAAQRDFTEPFLLDAVADLQELAKEAAVHGLKITRGGRFFHLIGADQNKGLAVAETLKLFQAGCSERVLTVGLGDAENDFPMLKAVDIPVLIPKPDGSFENLTLPGLQKAPYPGSRGWGAAVMAIMDRYTTKNALENCNNAKK